MVAAPSEARREGADAADVPHAGRRGARSGVSGGERAVPLRAPPEKAELRYSASGSERGVLPPVAGQVSKKHVQNQQHFQAKKRLNQARRSREIIWALKCWEEGREGR